MLHVQVWLPGRPAPRLQWRDRAGFAPASAHRNGWILRKMGGERKSRAAMPERLAEHNETMTLTVRLISHAANAELRAGSFPDDAPLDARGLAEAARAASHWRWPREARALSSPARRARQTAEALGLDAEPEPALSDLDAGRWRGRKLTAIANDAPEQLEAWITDPAAAPPGGESHLEVLRRVSAWLDALPASGSFVAVTHAAVLRAALAHALGISLEAMLRIDIAPLSGIELKRSPRGWIVRLDDKLPSIAAQHD